MSVMMSDFLSRCTESLIAVDSALGIDEDAKNRARLAVEIVSSIAVDDTDLLAIDPSHIFESSIDELWDELRRTLAERDSLGLLEWTQKFLDEIRRQVRRARDSGAPSISDPILVDHFDELIRELERQFYSAGDFESSLRNARTSDQASRNSKGSESLDGPRVEAYVAFPSFSDWNGFEFDSSTFDRFEQQLSDAKTEADSTIFDAVIEQATRTAAVDTGALEGIYEVDRGFTYSVAVGVAVMENIKALKGEKAARAIEDALNAYEFVLNAATKADPISEVWIRELHATICASQNTYSVLTSVGPQDQELPKGQYKTQPNSPLHLASNVVHSYAPVTDTPSEMNRLIGELRSDEFVSAHPIVQASYAHYAFVAVHPFADGNGRVARALASVFFYRRCGIPLVIFADQKLAYLDALEAADAGNFTKFISFVNFRAVDTLATARQDLRAASAPSVSSQLASLAALQTGRGGLPHTEIDNLATYLIESAKAAFDHVIGPELSTPPLSSSVYLVSGDSGRASPNQYRKVVSGPVFLQIAIASAAPGSANVQSNFFAVVAKPDVNGPDMMIMDGERVVFEAFVHDLSPAPSASLVQRLDRWANSELSAMLSVILQQSAASLRATGYGL